MSFGEREDGGVLAVDRLAGSFEHVDGLRVGQRGGVLGEVGDGVGPGSGGDPRVDGDLAFVTARRSARTVSMPWCGSTRPAAAALGAGECRGGGG
jgi:hypothetical protein